MSQDNTKLTSSSWISRTFRFILRLLLVVFIGLGLGVGIYLGVSYLANRYFQSVQVNAERITALETNQTLSEDQTKQRMETLVNRMQSLEKANDSQNVAEADKESRLAALETIQSPISTAMQTVNQQSNQIGTLQARISSLQSTQQALVINSAVLAQTAASQDTAIQTLSVEWDGAKGEVASALQDVELLKAMELLSRARLNLYQNNLGLAQQDIQSAREIILAVYAGGSGEQAAAPAAILARLDSALERLPGMPVAASDDIEGAWYLLAMGLDQINQAVSPVATIVPDQTPTPLQTLSLTPTPTP